MCQAGLFGVSIAVERCFQPLRPLPDPEDSYCNLSFPLLLASGLSHQHKFWCPCCILLCCVPAAAVFVHTDNPCSTPVFLWVIAGDVEVRHSPEERDFEENLETVYGYF